MEEEGIKPSETDGADVLLIGHVTRDVQGDPAERRYRQGGTVSFAAAVALGLDRRPSILTRAELATDLDELPAGVDICRLPSPVTTTFHNIYTPTGRTQYCLAAAPEINVSDIPERLRRPSAVLLGPLVQEIPPALAAFFDEETLVAAVPQGWMRSWDETGLVSHIPWGTADEILPHVDVLILSLEDIDNEISRLFPWFELVPLIIVTEYRDGSTVFQRRPNGAVAMFRVPPRPANEVDPTGAGDIFATSFLIRYQETGDPLDAARFANVAASFSVEYIGISGMPSRRQVLDYMAEHPFTGIP
jgi:1D-myo-inositol 3-kinase